MIFRAEKRMRAEKRIRLVLFVVSFSLFFTTTLFLPTILRSVLWWILKR
jgi:hypothetical protein